MKRLLIVSHCILNTASKVAMDEKELQLCSVRQHSEQNQGKSELCTVTAHRN